MPVPLAAKAGVIALSVAVAAAIAVYESPEIRRMADDLRRRIAVALQSLGEGIAPNGENGDETNREPVFNRPEDADGFMLSRTGRPAEGQDVVADEESRRRQRDELLYWNRLHLERQKKREEEQLKALAEVEKATREAAAAAGIPASVLLAATASDSSTPTTFDQLLRQDQNADRGTLVVNTGADYADNDGLLRRRQNNLRAFTYTNPFADEYGIELDEQTQHQATGYLSPEPDEIMSDIYNATEPDTSAKNNANNNKNVNSMDGIVSRDMSASVVPSTIAASELFFDATDPVHNGQAEAAPASVATLGRDASSPEMLDRLLESARQSITSQDQSLLSLNESRQDAFSSIQAWAQNSSATAGNAAGFYSPLPVTPTAPVSEPDVISTGDLTPTDSMSIVGDAEVEAGAGSAVTPQNQSGISTPSLVHETASQASGKATSYGVMSDDEDGDGMMTPTSWTEVGSVLSESDAGVPPMTA